MAGVGLLVALGVLLTAGTASAGPTFASSWESGAGNNASLTAGPSFPVTGTATPVANLVFIVNAIFASPTGFLEPNAFIYFGNISGSFVLTSISLSEDGTNFVQQTAGHLLGIGDANSAHGVDISGIASNLRDGVTKLQVAMLIPTTGNSVQLTGVSNPEPATIALFAFGLGGTALAGYRRRRKLRAGKA
jgi:hypothetical protein